MRIKSLFFSWVICVFACGSLLAEDAQLKPSIVFVHIGQELPDYLETAIKQARLFNSCDIILVANECAILKARPQLEKQATLCVSCESLQKTCEHEKFLQNSNLDRTFRGGFWSHAVERFFYLQDLIKQNKLTHVVHLESDNMLYVDVSELLPIFAQHYPHLAITLDNDGRCIPGFFYVANVESMDHLAQFLSGIAHSGKTDMEGIAWYCQEFGTVHSNQLPIIMTSYINAHALVSPYNHVAKDKFAYCRHIDLFQSIFDAAAIGQYLGGIDPRNGPSQPGFINESCVFNPSLLHYEWKLDGQGRKVPYASYRDSKVRINNLHVHCKNLTKFLSR